MSNKNSDSTWTVDSARDLYNVRRWGAGYFDINAEGNVSVRPLQDQGIELDLMRVISESKDQGVKFPALFRFQDILRHRVKTLNLAFRDAIEEFGYRGRYRGVFPVKVNQLREVVEEILDAGSEFDFGLEVGSKPELHASMALQEQRDALIVCNGYKDTSFVHTALLGTKLGKKVILVVEKLEELDLILDVSDAIKVEPSIGVRIRLNARGAGRWSESSGEKSKFGLNTVELLKAIERLKARGREDCLRLIHFHIGSQVTDILRISKAVREAARFYAKLRSQGFAIDYMDVGGGLGVDYDGSRSATESSVNYTLREYARDIVYHIGEVCDEESAPHPDIISESGRAIVAHHSVLVVEPFGAIRKDESLERSRLLASKSKLVKDLIETLDRIEKISHLEALHDAAQIKNQAENLFNLGMLEIEDRANVESLFWEIGRLVVAKFRESDFVPEEILNLQESMGDQIFCNFSVFQSLLDYWGMGQLFPILPLSRHGERPDREATLVDITCDSDGRITHFINPEKAQDTLPMHGVDSKGSQGYYLGVFLMGAYQDIMGDLHNLFGRVNEAHVFLDPDEPAGYYFEEIIEGTTIGEALGWVQYDPKDLIRKMKRQVDAAIREDQLKPSEAMQALKEFERGLSDYTYMSL